MLNICRAIFLLSILFANCASDTMVKDAIEAIPLS